MKTIASRYWDKNNPVFYVSELIGNQGDWGYTTDAQKAVYLSSYWQRRFKADCDKVGVKATFIKMYPPELKR